MANFGNFWTIFGNFWQFLAIFGQFLDNFWTFQYYCTRLPQQLYFPHCAPTQFTLYTNLLLGLLSPPIRTSLDGLVAETNDSAGLDLTAVSIDTFMLLGKVDGGGFREFFFTSVSEGSSVCCNSNSSSVT